MPKGQFTGQVLSLMVVLLVGLTAVVSVVNTRINELTLTSNVRNESFSFTATNNSYRVTAGDIRNGGLLSGHITNATGFDLVIGNNGSVINAGNNSVTLRMGNVTNNAHCDAASQICFIGRGVYNFSYNYEPSDYLINGTQRTIIRVIPLGLVLFLLVASFAIVTMVRSSKPF